jgi:hypothetical protein
MQKMGWQHWPTKLAVAAFITNLNWPTIWMQKVGWQHCVITRAALDHGVVEASKDKHK